MTQATYEGSCQCGAVTFSADLDLDSVVTCNCSRCQRLGSVLTFAPRAALRVHQGLEGMSEYRFNRNVIAHKFCPVCGIEPFGLGTGPDGAEVAAVNVNCLHGVDPRALTPHHYDGAAV